LKIGDAGSLNRKWAGSIDEVAVYNAALTAQEVAILYNSGTGREAPKWAIPTGLNTPRKQYLRYKAYFGTLDQSATPQLDDFTIGYSGFQALPQALTSSKFNSTDSGNLIKQLKWYENNTSIGGTNNGTVTVSLRAATSNAGLTGSFTDFTNATSGCANSSGTITCTIPSGSAFLDADSDQWFQYKTTLTSANGSGSPTADTVEVIYDTPVFAITGSTSVTAGTPHAITITAKDSSGTALTSVNGYTNYGSLSTPLVTISDNDGTAPLATKGTPAISKDNLCSTTSDNYDISLGSVQKVADNGATNFSAFTSAAMTVYGCFYDAGDAIQIKAEVFVYDPVSQSHHLRPGDFGMLILEFL
jgi:hypothetical protein